MRRRIVSLVPAATEILFAIGAGGEVVGRSSYCDWPVEARDLPAMGDAVSLNAEGILGLRPTLVLVGSRAQEDALGPLRDLCEVERVSPERVADVLAAVARLALLTERGESGRRIAESIVATANAPDVASGTRKPRVLFVVQQVPLVVAGANSYGADLLKAAGAENVAGDLSQPWPVLSLESLVDRDPDVILDGSLDPDSEGASLRTFWGDFEVLRAVRNGRVIRVRDAAVFRPGPRFPGAVAIVKKLLAERPR